MSAEVTELTGKRVRCLRCKRWTSTAHPCKRCGGLRHIVAMETIRWDHHRETIEEAMGRARRKVLTQWHRQAGMGGPGRKPQLLPGENQPVTTAALSFFFEGNDITAVFSPHIEEEE